MNINDAWNVLGFDPEYVMDSIKNSGGLEEKKRKSLYFLNIARNTSKKLLSAHHPDKNIGDIESSMRFNRVSESILIIEKTTKEFEEMVDRAINSGVSSNNKIKILIGQ
jgi:hypothetical protein